MSVSQLYVNVIVFYLVLLMIFGRAQKAIEGTLAAPDRKAPRAAR